MSANLPSDDPQQRPGETAQTGHVTPGDPLGTRAGGEAPPPSGSRSGDAGTSASAGASAGTAGDAGASGPGGPRGPGASGAGGHGDSDDPEASGPGGPDDPGTSGPGGPGGPGASGPAGGGPSGGARRLLRSRRDRVIAGVCGGAGRYLGIDPVVLRIAVVVLAFFGGAGILLYLAAVLLVPLEDEAAAAAGAAAEPSAPATDRSRVLVVLGIVALVFVAAPLVAGPAFFAGGMVIPLLLLALLGFATAWLVTGRRPEREAGAILRATLLGLGVLVLIGALAICAFWGAAAGGEAVIAALVIAAGVAVLAGAFVRPARWLILPALAVAVPAAFVSAAGIELEGGYGERLYRPASAAQLAERYELAAGQLTVDLRGADLPAGDHRLELQVGMGEAVVLVAQDVCVSTRADLGVGGVDVFERDSGGVDFSWVDEQRAEPGAARLLLDADIGFGHLDVRHTDDLERDGWDGRTAWRDDPDEAALAGEGNTACATA